MKKKLLIGLGTFYTLIIVAVIAVVIYFWSYISAIDWGIVNPSNIKALYQGLTEAPEVTAEKKKKLDSERSNEIREYVNLDLREFTEEEKKQIESGEKSETQILAQIITETVEKNEQDEALNNTQNENVNSENVNTDEKKPEEGNDSKVENNKVEDKPKPQGDTAEKIVARHVSQLYAIQSEFEGRVNALAGSVKNWTAAYYRSHKGIKWRDAKVAAVEHFSGTTTQIENECYARVDAQIAKLKTELEAIGADTSITATVKSTAYAEMEARKAQIVQQAYAEMNE